MKKINSRSLLALAILALAFAGAGVARAQYATSVGTAPGGGNVVTGSGNLPSLVTQPPLSAGGFDLVTLEAGSNLSIAAGTAIQFTTSSDTVVLLGAINIAGSGGAVFFTSGTASSVTNKGSITIGGNGNAIQFVDGDGSTAINSGPINIMGNGVGLYFGSGNNATAVNSSSITIGIGGQGIFLNSGNGATVSNSGPISIGSSGGQGIYLGSGDGATVNSSGSITVNGNGSGIFLNSGNNAVVTSSGPISVTGNGSGIQIGSGDGSTVNNSASISVGGGQGIFINSGIGANVTNSGAISLASSGNGINLGDGDGATVANSAAITVNGNGSGIFLNSGIGSSVSSSGPISVTGNGDGIQLGDGDGATVVASSSISVAGGQGIFLNSGIDAMVVSSASISVGSGGGNGIDLGDGDGATVTNSGAINLAVAGDGILVNSGNNATVTNSGAITLAGNGDGIFLGTGDNATVKNSGAISVGGNGDAIQLNSGNNSTVKNTGSINVAGNGVGVYVGGGSGFSLVNIGSIGIQGTGFAVYSNGGNNNTFTNIGTISGGSDGRAINIVGSNNTINLNGHSSVFGLISATGATNSNVLNLNFTGMSASAIAALKAQFAAQGISVNSGVQSSGYFTVRGITYTYDPLVVNLNVSSYQLQGLTPNQQAVGASLDSLATNPVFGSPLSNLYSAIDASGAVPQALEALSPQKYQLYGDLAIANTTQAVLEIDQRLNNIRTGSESIDTTGVGGGSTQAATAGYSKDDSKDNKNVVQTAPQENRWGFFAAGDGLLFRGNSKDIDMQQGKSNNAGTIAGVDGKIGENAVIGALFAYNNADATLGSDNSHAVIDSYSGGIYTGYHQDGFYANGLAAYTRNNYSSDRNISFPGFAATAGGSTNGNQESVNLDGGYDWHASDCFLLGPLAGLQYVHADVEGFNEFGAGAADLAVGRQNINSLQSRLGAHMNYHRQLEQNVALAVDLSASWQHEYLDDSRGIGAGFIGSGLAPFSVQTTSPLRDAAVVSLGVNFTFHDRLTLFADYSLLLWRASYFEQTVNGGLRVSF